MTETKEAMRKAGRRGGSEKEKNAHSTLENLEMLFQFL